MSYIPPIDSETLSRLTLSMIVDELPSGEVSYIPNECKRVFRWIVECERDQVPERVPDVPISQLLFVCRPCYVDAFLESNPNAFALTTEGDSDLKDVARDGNGFGLSERYAARVLILARDACLEDISLTIQNLFSRILIWEGALDRIALRGGSLGEMLDASVDVLGNFMFVSDYNFNVVASASLIEPPDDLHRTIVATGCLSQRIIAEKRFRLPEGTFYTRKASSVSDFDRVSYPVHLDHSYFGSVSMTCNGRPDTQGLRDTFQLMCGHMRPLCRKMWNIQVRSKTPSFFFFSRLLKHEQLDTAYVQDQMAMMGMTAMNRFKLVVLDIDEGSDPDRASLVVEAVLRLNGGAVHCFPYRGQLLALLFSSGMEGELSHKRTMDELVPWVYEPYGVCSYMSAVFFHIEDLDLAYSQAQIASEYRTVIKMEALAGNDPVAEGVVFFEDALGYYLVDSSERDDRFMGFIFASSVVGVLYYDDLQSGTRNLPILWHFIQSDRNATAVARRMHMHRNTVLYHIEKIEKKFDFSLSSKTVCDWLTLCFKYLFLKIGTESIGQLFEKE